MGDRIEYIGLDGKRVVTDTRTLAEAQAEAADRIDAAFSAQIEAGVTYSGKPLQIDELAQSRMAAVVTQTNAGVALPAGFAWRMSDNTFLPVTSAQMIALAAAAAARVMALRKAMWAAKDAARAAKAREEADAIQAKWP